MSIYTAAEAAEIIGVKQYTVVRSAKRNGIGQNLSGRYFFTPKELRQLKAATPIRGKGCPLFSDPEFIAKNRRNPKKGRKPR